MREFVGDVGDLVKLTMVEDGVRHITDSSEKIAHELARSYGNSSDHIFILSFDSTFI